MKENNIQNEQLNQEDNLISNENMDKNQIPSQSRGPFHAGKEANNPFSLNRLNMIRNGNANFRNNLHLLDKVNQRKNMPPINRGIGRKNQGEIEGTDESTTTEDGVLEQNKSTKKKGVLDKKTSESKSENDEGIDAVNSLFGKNKKEDPTDKAIKGSLKLAAKTALMPILTVIVTVFLILLVVLSVPVMVLAAFSPIFAVAEKLGFDTGGEEYSSDDSEESEFSERLSNVMEDYKEENQETVAKVVSGVFAVVNSYNNNYNYEDMSESQMKDVANMLIDTKTDGQYNPEKFKQDLASDFLPDHIKNMSKESYLKIAEEVYEYIEGYHTLIEDEQTINVDSGNINQCNYDLTTVNYENGKKINAGIKPSNIKVRLMQSETCGGSYGKPLAGEELVDFEKYVLGVAYAEIGDIEEEEAFKAQLVVARSFALVNAVAMKRNSLKQENGQWIMEITNCNSDQYYCDPDKGCSWDATSGNRHVISGTDGPDLYKQPLPVNAKQRSWAIDVMGKVALDAQGNLFWTNFTDTTQKQMRSLANSGMDYTSILVNIYKADGFSMLADSNCKNVSTGIYSTWKQNNPVWANIVLGGGTDMDKSIGKIGCLATSLAILVQKSGVLLMDPKPTLVDNATFTPGTFVTALNKVNAFTSIGELSSYLKVTSVVPKFSFHSSTSLSGKTKEEKLTIIKEKIDNGLYCVAQVLDGSTNEGTHFVAIDYIDSQNNIKMIDPGAADYGTDMWQGYDWHQTSKMHCYEVK